MNFFDLDDQHGTLQVEKHIIAAHVAKDMLQSMHPYELGHGQRVLCGIGTTIQQPYEFFSCLCIGG